MKGFGVGNEMRTVPAVMALTTVTHVFVRPLDLVSIALLHRFGM